jgi:hypothetical protein
MGSKRGLLGSISQIGSMNRWVDPNRPYCWDMTIPSGGGLGINGPDRHSDLLLRLAGMAEPPATLTKA